MHLEDIVILELRNDGDSDIEVNFDELFREKSNAKDENELLHHRYLHE